MINFKKFIESFYTEIPSLQDGYSCKIYINPSEYELANIESQYIRGLVDFDNFLIWNENCGTHYAISKELNINQYIGIHIRKEKNKYRIFHANKVVDRLSYALSVTKQDLLNVPYFNKNKELFILEDIK